MNRERAHPRRLRRSATPEITFTLDAVGNGAMADAIDIGRLVQ
jgi:hypothetical protein